MSEALGIELVKDLLANMTEWGVPQVMTEGNGLGQVLIEVQGAAYSTGYLGDLQGMGEAGSVVVT
jgi:hypothetical protein